MKKGGSVVLFAMTLFRDHSQHWISEYSYHVTEGGKRLKLTVCTTSKDVVQQCSSHKVPLSMPFD